MMISVVDPVQATTISDLEKEKQELEKQKEEAQNKQKEESDKLNSVSGRIDSIQGDADAVAEEIDEADAALVAVFGLLGALVFVVLTEVAEGPGRLDLLDQLGTQHPHPVVDLLLHFFNIHLCQLIIHIPILLSVSRANAENYINNIPEHIGTSLTVPVCQHGCIIAWSGKTCQVQSSHTDARR